MSKGLEMLCIKVRVGVVVYSHKILVSLVPRLSPCTNEKWKGKGRDW